MRKACLKIIATSISAVAITGTSVHANPALMALRRSAKPEARENASPRTVESVQAESLLPSKQISPMRNPVKYLSATISEMPIGKNKLGASANPTMRPATQHNDSISLNTPVGPPTPQLFITAAQMSESQGDIAQARAHYQQALSMWPGQVDVLRAAARMEDRLGQLPVAENLYQQAVAKNPQHAGALNDLGLCLARQGKLEASVQVLEQAIQLQHDKALYRNNAATVLVEMRQDQRALAHLAHVHNAADANYNFGQLLVQRGRAADATPYFQAAVEQNPQLQPAHVALAKLRGQSVEPATTSPTGAPSVPATPPQAGPQLYYPATATAPGFGTSSYVPPRYLPPVAAQPGPLQR